MSHAAMTGGLEWNLKVTAQDLSHLLAMKRVDTILVFAWVRKSFVAT